MGNVNPIPEKLVNFNVYQEGEKLVGVASEITLPTLEGMSETVSGAGIAGEFESATPGHFSSMTTEIAFKTLFDKAFKLMKPGGQTLTFRASQQFSDFAGNSIDFRPLKIVMKVLPKSVDLGKMAVSAKTETKNTLEVVYIKITENGNEILELDKVNFIYKINGEDILGPIQSQI